MIALYDRPESPTRSKRSTSGLPLSLTRLAPSLYNLVPISDTVLILGNSGLFRSYPWSDCRGLLGVARRGVPGGVLDFRARVHRLAQILEQGTGPSTAAKRRLIQGHYKPWSCATPLDGGSLAGILQTDGLSDVAVTNSLECNPSLHCLH